MAKYKAYPEYKESGVEWLGEVPRDWDVINIKYLSQVKRGASPRPIDDQKFFDEDGDYAWVRIADVTASDTYLLETPQKMSALGSSLSVKLESNQLFLSIAGTVGKPCITAIKACIHDGFVYFPYLKIPNKFLFYVFAGEQAYKGLGKMGTQLNLNTDTVGGIKVALPSNNDFIAKIVGFLDHETAKIDNLIERQQQLIELLKEKRQAVISHAVTKGLNPDVPMKDSGVEWLGEVPANWDSVRVKQISSFITSGPRGWSDYITDDGNEIFLQSGDLNNELGLQLDKAKRVSPPKNAEGVRTRLMNGDVVICITGANTGRVAIVSKLSQKTYINQHLSLIRPETLKINSSFLGYCLTSSNGRSYFEVAQYGLKEGLNLSNIAEAPLALPPLHEQDAIVKYLECVQNNYDYLSCLLANQVGLLQERRTALISAAVTGKIDVRDWVAPERQDVEESQEATA